MNNTFYMLRHGETQFTREKTSNEWSLSPNGISQVIEVSESGCFDDIDVIVSSMEEKALQTAMLIANRVHKEISVNFDLGEHDRRNSGFLEQNEFDEAIQYAFTNMDQSKRRWETAQDALDRFTNAVNEIDSKYEASNILVVSHGTVLSLYFANKMRTLDNVYDRWKTLDYCSWSIVQGRQVMKDIV